MDKVIPLKEVMREHGFYIPASISCDTLVQEYGAVVSRKRQLIKNGTFILFDDKVCRMLIHFIRFIITCVYLHFFSVTY